MTQIPWNKGLTKETDERVRRNAEATSKGKKGKVSPKKGKHYEKCSLAKRNENNPRWKGDDVSYFALHIWLRKNKKPADRCEHCGKKTKLDCANISGKYRRDVNDYKWLCRSCHIKYDNRMRCI